MLIAFCAATCQRRQVFLFSAGPGAARCGPGSLPDQPWILYIHSTLHHHRIPASLLLQTSAPGVCCSVPFFRASENKDIQRAFDISSLLFSSHIEPAFVFTLFATGENRCFVCTERSESRVSARSAFGSSESPVLSEPLPRHRQVSVRARVTQIRTAPSDSM